MDPGFRPVVMVNCLAGMFNYGMAIPSVGPARCRPPRHMMPFNSINARHVIGCCLN